MKRFLIALFLISIQSVVSILIVNNAIYFIGAIFELILILLYKDVALSTIGKIVDGIRNKIATFKTLK